MGSRMGSRLEKKMQERAILLVLGAACASALVSVPSVFSDGCVLQTNAEYGARSYVYGLADPSEQVFLNVEARGASTTSYAAVAEPSGSWRITLNPVGQGVICTSLPLPSPLCAQARRTGPQLVYI